MAKNIFGKRKGGQPPRYGASKNRSDVGSESSIVVRPKTTMIPASKMSSAIVRVPKIRKTESYDQKISNIQNNLVEIDSILKGTLAMEKQDAERKTKQGKQQKRTKLENQIENKNGILKSLLKTSPTLRPPLAIQITWLNFKLS